MKRWMKWGLVLMLLVAVLEAEDRSYRVLYAYNGNNVPLRYQGDSYLNRIWGYRIGIPSRFRDGNIINQNTWGIMLSPPLSKRARGFLMGEFFDVSGFGPVSDLESACESEKRLMLKKGPNQEAKLIRYDFAGDHCRIEVEGHLGNEAFGSLAYLARRGKRGVRVLMQYPPSLRDLYHRIFEKTVASLQWLPVPAGWTVPSPFPAAATPKNPIGAPSASAGGTVSSPVGSSSSHSTGTSGKASSATGRKEWAEGYDNPVWGIHLRFPAGFFITPPLKTRDYGVVFPSMDRRSLLYISWAETPASLRQIYRVSLEKMRRNPDLRITYRRIDGHWFVISSINQAKGTISYMKGYKKGRRFLLYLLIYPMQQKRRYDELIPVLNRQFGPSGQKSTRRRQKRHHRISGRCCDAMARTCYAECPDENDGCLERCEARRDRCYRTGRW
ncbi:hypothetical protein [Nitratifractor salsuginis]|uniref:Uncharacterized protein n=1 Tax=Nitratifractor salsuginis (strain DSM 16511 / JCM 12458 / E9I37-1) TaxID=749222 RepID=E6X327_NITSE|nr:hypothetical protein [Nitratifractor salsuginis]ADV46171.1 hypothetical protein Nitsa_0911 [Nitratifractor salsuginis DSM 16511]